MRRRWNQPAQLSTISSGACSLIETAMQRCELHGHGWQQQPPLPVTGVADGCLGKSARSAIRSIAAGHNLRFPESAAVAPARIVICTTPAQVRQALQSAVHDGVRPTVRSGGHCYENFYGKQSRRCPARSVTAEYRGLIQSTGEYCVPPGAVLGDIYQSLYKREGLTLPGGTCYSVGAGGHISGGGLWLALAAARPHL